ncbi:MAG: HlyC/CorC family transporter [Candidatus Omnitrophica bacterium]|nr:HlyC/CorC family transporter [Candidatus Omnitrophota bacterium]
MNLPLSFLALFFLLLLAAFFAAIETALFSLSRIDRNRLQKNHPRWAPWVLRHLEHPRQALTSILIGTLFVQILSTSIVTLMAVEIFGSGGIGPLLTLFTLVFIIFGEILPKIVAVRNNELVSLWLSIPLTIFSFLIFPLRKLTRLISDRILSHLIKEKIESIETISEDELKALVKVGEEEGILDRQERHMIQKIFDLGERQVRDIMTPRIDVRGIDIEDSVEKHLQLIKQHHHTEFPVCKGSLDNILGVISVQDYVLSETKEALSMLRQPLFVPEIKRIDDVLAEFRNQKHHFAVCVDEYGGTSGIVTLEDILEEVFGEFYDEYEKVENPIRPYGFHEFLVEAKIPISEFNEKLNLHLEAKEATTLGGYILEHLEEVPEKGKNIHLPECSIRIHEVIRQRRILSVIVRLPS